MKVKLPKKRLLCTSIVWFALSLILLLVPSCASVDSYYAYTATAFCAQVEGQMNGLCVQATVAAVPNGEGYFVEVEYLAPASLSGLSLTGSCTREGKAFGELTYRFCGKSGCADASLCPDLLLPVTSLLCAREPLSVERLEGGYLLSFPENGLLQLDHRSIPLRVREKNADFWVVWWNFNQK